MTQHANVLNFNEAAALLGYKRKQPEPQAFKLTRCHDGVLRVLKSAEKFRGGGITLDWTGPETVIKPNFKHGFPG